MRSGLSGFVERSRIENAVRRAPAVVYHKGEGPGSGALQPQDEADPAKQAERFVARVAGPAEVQWAQQRTHEYRELRAMRLKVAEWRHALLKKAVASQQYEAQALRAAREEERLLTTATPVMLADCRAKAGISVSVDGAGGGDVDSTSAAAGKEDAVLRQFLQLYASPEQMQAILPDEALAAVEEKVMQLKQALAEQYMAEQE